jgi:hypothetical protein
MPDSLPRADFFNLLSVTDGAYFFGVLSSCSTSSTVPAATCTAHAS